MGFQQGLSGLNAASKNLDVIGHNIANSNTTGFKSSRADFAEMVASAIGSASGQSSGIGVNVAAVSQQFRQGSITSTGNSLDIAINGNGFFVVKQADGSTAYTRAGNFGLDKEGNLKTVDNDNVMGYMVDPATGKIQSGATPVPLSFPTGQPIPAKQTSKVNVELNLDSRATLAAGDATATPPIAATPRATYGTSLNVYDTQGTAIPVNLYFEKDATGNTWNIYNSLDATASPIGQATFDASGKLTGVTPGTGTSLNLSINGGTANPNGLPAFNVEMDFGGLTQFGTKFAVSSLKQDGYTSGALTGINVGRDGSIVAAYSNGVTRTEGQIALAAFTNTQGLGSIGNNKWVQTADSGPALNGSAQTGTFGSLQAGALEESNVDLTAELVNMMTAQRSYQANAQTIKTQDQVFSTLVNLR
ncbi:MAG: flagellar hook protein FlgE [Comamonas sp.]|uniref:flagellar hook protein FlgE n=1 Tax=Comamonas sp. TaxID=34028 RepID=UPI002FC72892